ncbi:endolytic transglycosylase MltG [Virgisporangium aurantiacum]|uniref:Endolytic murein transglycosylase n=1 Tax=Virgisporangium aurantiacum TaxID=175570 RepID=A0A8J3Z678_9ACTN|nr:endolytic transglycosylase MltG [Virgisporangium aurantiacum]GIJ58171.1 hypothetical protein Vau01_056870 [Virgisporangium aurantiacum]
MSDDLGLSFDDGEGERGRHRHRRRPGGSGGGKTAVALIVVVAILGCIGGGVWYGFDKIQNLLAAPDYNSGGSGEVQVSILANQTATQIGAELEKLDVVKSQKAFVEAAKDNPRSKEIQPGVYKLRKQMRAADALLLLLDRDQSRQVLKFTVPEGKTVIDTLNIITKETKIPLADLQEAAKDPKALGVPDFWFKRNDGKQVKPSIEGFLYPQTYEFDPGTNAKQMLTEMVGHFIEVATTLKFVDRVQAERGISPYEALITASLSQAEAGVAEDLAKIARVTYNRVYKAKIPLQYDVTANYWLQLNGKPMKPSSALTAAELDDKSSPYNTTSVKGLPIGPINNPGEAALKGAMDPPAGDWIFFVAIDKAGHSAFATTDAEHEANKKIACQNGVLTC